MTGKQNRGEWTTVRYALVQDPTTIAKVWLLVRVPDSAQPQTATVR